MISVNEARERLMAQVQPVGTNRIGIERALNRVLAEDIASPIDYPLFDNSSMDGFAVMAADVAGAAQDRPVVLSVVGDIPAGVAPDLTLTPGCAVRIMTGAVVPMGADAIVPVEATDQPRGVAAAQLPDKVLVYKPALPGDYIRPRGQDILQGQIVLYQGRRLLPQDLGLLAMLGVPEITVYNLPRVALLSSGDELVPVDQPLSPGKIHDSNTSMLSALLRQAGVEIIPLGVAKDDYADLEARLNQAESAGADLLITSAGVSVGSFDFMRSVIEAHGAINFWEVNMRPGKPVAFGHYNQCPILSLPGNPASAFVGFELFVRPILDRLKGLKHKTRASINVVLDEPIQSDGRESYLRGVLQNVDGIYHASLSGHQGSGNLLAIVLANALLIVPSGVKSLPAGIVMQAWWID